MNIMSKPPLGLKQPKAKPNPAYLRKVRDLNCCICEAFGLPQLSGTTAHHPICGRFGNLKCPDHEAIPLCEGHHQGDFDTSKIAIHRDRALWVETYGPDTDWIAVTQDKIATTV
ncbi:hypothetical protein [Epibacterium ulvae]|uniref:hypothetical protein n=1 Tax=Epibacterium ulvae TaxID=1156985 RepID=UPI0024936DBE|nr:hypothetical protein [Epibacterium ulvae]